MLKRLFVSLLIVILLYCYIFNPYPFRGGLIKLLYPILLVIPFSSRGMIMCKKHSGILMAFILVFMNTFIIYLAGGEHVWVNSFINIFEMFFIPIGLVILFNKYIKNSNLMFYILVTAMIASIITIILIYTPQLNLIIRSLANSSMVNDLRRSYGFSQFLLFTYPILMGVLISYVILCKGLLNYFIVIPMLFAIAFNARIGFFPIIFAICLILLFRRKYNVGKYKQVLYLSIISVFVYFIATYLLRDFESTFIWIQEGMNETVDLTGGKKTGTFGLLLDEMIILPESFAEVVFGTGHSLYRKSIGNSDIGYINQIWFGGVIHLLLLSNIYYKACKVLKGKVYSIFLWVIIFALLISNLKGGGFYSTELTRFVMLLMFYESYKTLDRKYLYRECEIICKGK